MNRRRPPWALIAVLIIVASLVLAIGLLPRDTRGTFNPNVGPAAVLDHPTERK